MNKIKEGFDTLSLAMAIFDDNGLVTLINKKMMQLSVALMGSEFQHIDEVKQALIKQDNITIIDKEKNIYLFKDQYIQFNFREIVDRYQSHYTELTAFDVNDLMSIHQQLKENNRQLELANEQTRKLCENSMEIARQEEILSLKIKVHDVIGYTITEARRLLRKADNAQMIKEGITSWQKTIEALYKYNDQKDDNEPIAFAFERAKQLGVDIKLSGQLPEKGVTRYLTALIIRECTNNSMKHASATKLYVDCQKVNDKYHLSITDNGKIVLKEVCESGGLVNLRKAIEKEKGEMVISAQPQFKVEVILPNNERDSYV